MMDFCLSSVRTFLACTAIVTLIAAASDAQVPTAPESSAGELPGLQQPGDDILTPLPETARKPDKQREEALAWYMDALAAQKEGDFPAALKSLEKAIAADPTASEPVKSQALLLMGLGRMEQAEEAASRAIQLDADDFETRLRLAIVLLSRGEAGRSVQLLEEALASKRIRQHSPELIQLHSIRGRLALELKDTAKAAESYGVLLNALERPEDFGLDFRQHNALMTDRNTGYQAIGTVMLQLGRNDDAIAAFKALARVNNDAPGDYHLALAQAYFRADRNEEAEASLYSYFETKHRSRQALELLRDLYAATNRTEQLVERLRLLSEDTRDVGTVNLFLGEQFLARGEIEAATGLYEQVINETGDADAYLGLLRVDVLKRDTDSLLTTMQKALRARIQIQELVPLASEIASDKTLAESVVDACLKRSDDPGSELFPEISYLCSTIAREIKVTEKEARLLQVTLDRNPGPALGIQALEQLGINQLAMDNYADAAGSFRRLLAVPALPQDRRVMALYRLSFAETFNANHAEAIAAVKAALDISPQNPELTYQLGWVQVQADEYQDAETTLKLAIRLSSGDPGTEHRARLLLGGLYAQQERWPESIEVYSALVASSSIDADLLRRTRLALSNAYVQQGDTATGERVLEEVYKTNPDDPGVNNDLGYLYADQGKNLEQAEKMIRLAVAAEPDNPAYLDSLGWVLFRLDRNEEALQALQKANGDPGFRDSTIMEHLGDVLNALNRGEDAVKTWKEALTIEEQSEHPDPAVMNRIKSKLPETGTETEEKEE
ncbi:MAG: tetratricopeptide repeat protein [Planctomycetaceae bacterium]